MKKYKIIPLLLTVLIISMPQIQAKQDEKLSFSEIKNILFDTNSGLKELDFEIKKLELQKTYAENNSLRQQDFMDEYEHYLNSSSSKAGMAYLIEYLPAMYESQLERLIDKKEVTKRSLEIGLREMYAGLLNSYNDMITKEEKSKIKETEYYQDKLKYEDELISEIELKESEYNLLSAKKEFENARRSFENLTRSFSTYVGITMGEDIESYIYKEDIWDFKLSDVDTYLKTALAENLEITSLKEDIELKNQEIEIYEKNDAYKASIDDQINHRDRYTDLEDLKIQLEDKIYEVTDNIRSAYVDVKAQRDSVENLEKNVAILETKVSKYYAQYQQGYITETVYDGINVELKNLKNSYDIAVFSYNTSLLKLTYAIGMGPEY